MELKDNLIEIYGNRFDFHFIENKSRSKVICKCNNCGTEYIRGYNQLKCGKLICDCEKWKKWTDDKIISFLNNKYENLTFEISDNIDDMGNADIVCTCIKCGNVFKAKFRTLRYYNVLCKKCEFVVHNKLTEGYVVNFIKDKGYEIISGSYLNEDSRFTLKCKDCGEEIITTYKSLKQQKKGCRNCQYNKLKKNHKRFEKELNDKYNGNIIAIEEYVNSYTPITFKCNVCGNIWRTTPDSIINKEIGCHNCNKGVSYPNKLMKNILLLFREGITIEEEKALKKINNSWNGNHRFDFLVTKNGKRVVIEMDGGFHNRENIKEIDIKKDNFAKLNDIDIIRINCEYKGISNRFSTIKNAILSSEIRKLVDIDSIDNDKWNELDEKSKKSTYREIYEFYLNHKDLTFKDIGKIFNKRGYTIHQIIKSFNK